MAALIIVSAAGQKLRSLEKNLCELCAFAPLRLCEKPAHAVWFLAKAQRRKVRKGSCGNLSSFTVAETMINAGVAIGDEICKCGLDEELSVR